MYTFKQALAIDNARDALAEVAQRLKDILRDSPLTSYGDRKTAALRDKVLEAIAGIDAMDGEPAPSLSGGAPDHEPTQADWDDYADWSEAHDNDAIHRDLYGY